MGNYDDLIIDEKFKDYIDSLKSQLDGNKIGLSEGQEYVLKPSQK